LRAIPCRHTACFKNKSDVLSASTMDHLHPVLYALTMFFVCVFKALNSTPVSEDILNVESQYVVVVVEVVVAVKTTVLAAACTVVR